MLVHLMMLVHLDVYVYHKTGNVLMQSLFGVMQRHCGVQLLTRKTSLRHTHTRGDFITSGRAASAGGSCCSAAIYDVAALGSVYHRNPNETLTSWDKLHAFAERWPRRAIVHLLREPFALTESFYLHHRAGAEGGFGMYGPLVTALRHASIQEGVAMAANFLLRFELPAMASLHKLLAGRDDVTTLRLEEITSGPAGFDAGIRSLLLAVGVGSRYGSDNDMVMNALRRHDLSRGAKSAHAHRDGVMAWQNATVVRAVLRSRQNWMLAEEIRAVGRDLGYSYYTRTTERPSIII